jgi:uncharacterized protein (DUF1697 family)
MTRYAALLRGINVGARKRVAMADLRALLSGMGFEDVRTLLQSGNAVFGAEESVPEELARRIEDRIEEELGMTVGCLVRTGPELEAAIAANPLPEEAATDGKKFLAIFLSKAPDPALLAEHDPEELAPDQIRLGDRVIYQWCPDGILEAPPVSAFVEKHLDVKATARNWNTLTKLSALVEE